MIRPTPLTLVPLLALLISLSASAQRMYSPNFAIGGKAGMTMARMSFSPKVQQAFSDGMVLGFKVRYTEENHFGLIGEINFDQRGWQEGYDPGYEQFHYRRTLNYIQVPLLTHLYWGGNKCKFFINLGPEVGFMISDNIDANFDYNNHLSVDGYPLGYRNSEQLAMEVTNRFDYGISGGLGLEFLIKKRHSLMLEARYYFGLGNIFPAAKKDYFAASRTWNLEFTLSYLIRVR